MTKTRRRIVLWTALTTPMLALALVGAVGAYARDGQARADETQAAETRGHDQEQEQAPQEDRTGQQAADDNSPKGRPLLRATLAPSLPTDPVIAGVAPGALPWTLARGSVLLQDDGRLRVTVEGLVIPSTGTTGPVQTITATLICASGGTTQTAAAPVSSTGDATIDDQIAFPTTCLAPIVLVNPNGGAAAYIAVTGWR